MKEIKFTPCYLLNISFNSAEGLNKFIEFLFKNNINGLGFESSRRNTIYSGVFTEEEINKIKENYNV